MNLKIDSNLTMELVDDKHCQGLYELAADNRQYLRRWLSWVEGMQDADFMQNFINGCRQRNMQGAEFAFVIMLNGTIVGRNGIYKIDHQHKTGEIGYWIGEEFEGKGIITSSTKRLIDFCFTELQLHRIEIRCSKENIKSQAIPQRLGFTFEGLLREAELLHGSFRDLRLYAKLNSEK